MEPIQKEIVTPKSKIRLFLEKDNPRFLYVILIVVLLLGGGFGIYLWRKSDNSSEKGNINISQTKSGNGLKSAESQSGATSQSNTSTQITAPSPQKTTKSFNFVDYANWADISSKDGAYTLKFGPSETHGYCANDQTTTLLGMVNMNQSGEYDCNSIMTALITGKPSLILTRLAFGLADETPTSADVLDVNLLNGVSAKRYEYTTVYGDKSYKNIEYITTNKNARYSAHLRWEDGYDLYSGSNVTPEYFDTIVQKTWKFN